MPDDSNYTQLQIENLIEENNIDEDLNEYFGDEDQELEAYSLECVYGADDYNDSTGTGRQLGKWHMLPPFPTHVHYN